MRLVASKAGVTGWLLRRECGLVRRPPPPFPQGPPPRLRVPIESFAEQRLLKVILLGFSRDGDHLLCYSQRGGAYSLHVWCFRGRSPAAPLVSVPLFAELREHAAHRELGGLFDDDDRVAPLRITMCETSGGADGSGALLVVHGCECRAEGDLAEAEDSPLWREPRTPHVPAGAGGGGGEDAAPLRNFVTCLPVPWGAPARVRAAAQLHATHFSYESVTPHPPFQPALCIVEGPPGLVPSLVLPTGEGLLAVHLADASDACAAPVAAPDGACDTRVQWAADEDGDGASSEALPPPVPPPPPRDPESDRGNEPGTPPAPPRHRVRLRARVAARFDAELYIGHVLSGALAGGTRLVDYTVQLCATHRADAVPHPLAVVQLLALLRPRCEDESGSSAAAPLRLVQLVCAVACGGDASVRLLLSRELRPLSPDAPEGALAVMGARLARALRQRGAAPVACAAALPHAMSNAGVLASWRSADAIHHPWLPLCITGFGITPATDDED